MLAREVRVSAELPAGGAIVIGTLAALRRSAPTLAPGGALAPDGFRLRTVARRRCAVPGDRRTRATARCCTARSRCCAGSRSAQPLANLDEQETPYAPQRWVNQWDNLDGTIERGYGGRSIFWDDGHVREDLDARQRIRPAARVGRHQRRRDQQRQRQPRVFLSPSSCRRWRASRTRCGRGACGSRWRSISAARRRRRARHVRSARPDGRRLVEGAGRRALRARFPTSAAFVLKADSEGRVGPSAYGGTHADAANVVARALRRTAA